MFTTTIKAIQDLIEPMKEKYMNMYNEGGLTGMDVEYLMVGELLEKCKRELRLTISRKKFIEIYMDYLNK